MGLVIDKEVAKASVCTCHAIGPEHDPESELFCFTTGVIGALTKPQIHDYCTKKVVVKEDGIRKRVLSFREASTICKKEVEAKYPKGQRLEPRLECMSRELAKRGIKA